MFKKVQLIRSILASNFKRLNEPYKVTFALTYRCNLKCEICRIWENSSGEEMGIQDIEKIFKSLNHLSWLDLTGGEITLRDDLTEVIEVIIKNSRKLLICHISTNGQLPAKIVTLVKKVLKSGVIPIVNVSVRASVSLADVLIRDDTYLQSLETFRLLKKLSKGYYYLSCTLTDHSINYIDNLLLRLEQDIPDFSIADLHFNIFYNSNHYFKNQNISGLSASSLEKAKEYMLLYKRGNFIKKFLEYRYVKVLVQSFKEDKFPLRCQALNSFCFISPHGEVYPCTAYNKIIGSLENYDYNLTRIWDEAYILKSKEDIGCCTCQRCLGCCEVYPAVLGDIRKALVL